MAKKAPVARHLTASMRVMRFHFARPALTVAEAHDNVKELAQRLGTDEATKDDQVLAAKLEKMTGVGIAELAKAAEQWPEV